MIVCHCKGISDRAIRRAVREGAVTVADVGSACGAGTGCQGCSEGIAEIIHAEFGARDEVIALPMVSAGQPNS